jgi:hypothetical protein
MVQISAVVYTAGVRRYGGRDQNQTNEYNLHIDVLSLGEYELTRTTGGNPHD